MTEITEQKQNELSKKIRNDFFIHLGINNPTSEQLNFIQYMDDDDLLAMIMIRLKNKGMMFSNIGRRYTTGRRIYNIRNRYKQAFTEDEMQEIVLEIDNV